MDSVTICNLALQMVGIPTITNMEETNNNARLCRLFYPVLRDRVLRDHPWSFAEAVSKLEVLAEGSPDPAYPYMCALPGDVIRVRRLTSGRPFRMHAGKILVTEYPEEAVYTRREEDPNKFDVLFVEALQYSLAAELGMANTRNTNLIGMYRQEYERRLQQARSVDSQENRYSLQGTGKRSNWIRARHDSGIGRLENRPVKWTEGTEGKQV